MTLYIISFKTFGTELFQISVNVFSKRKDAEKEVKQLRACGHTKVTIIKRKIRL